MENRQLQANVNESNQMVLIESRTMRDNHVYRDDVLDKVKALVTLSDTSEATIESIAEYYEVNFETIKKIVQRHRDEFNDYDEVRVLKGKALKEFKGQGHDVPTLKTTSVLMLINRRGVLRIGMLLTDSEIARSVRNYLLNVEEISDDAQRKWAVEREISKRERRMLTDAIKDFYKGVSMKGHEYSTFTNLVYKVLFDCNANKLREMYGLDKSDVLRDSLTTEDLRKVVEVERTISSLIKVGMGYDQIKDYMVSSQDVFR